jgi:sugar lactone lactonase YvrE
VYRYDPAVEDLDGSWQLPEPVSSPALRRSGGAVVALASGVATLDLVGGEVSEPVRVEAGLPTRLNDGKAPGRVLAGLREVVGHVGAVVPDPEVRIGEGLGVVVVDGDVRRHLRPSGVR